MTGALPAVTDKPREEEACPRGDSGDGACKSWRSPEGERTREQSPGRTWWAAGSSGSYQSWKTEEVT